MGALNTGPYPLDLTSLPVVVVVAALVAAVPIPRPLAPIFEALKAPVKPFLTLPEAEALLVTDDKTELGSSPKAAPIWPSVVLALTALFETLLWIVLGSYILVVDEFNATDSLAPYLVAVSWLYACCRPVFKLTVTPPYDLLVLYVCRILVDSVAFGGILYDKQIYGIPLPMPLYTASLVASLAGAVLSLTTVLSMPLGVPSARVDAAEIVRRHDNYRALFADSQQGKSVSPEDYTSVWGWASFHWVKPLITRGTTTTLQEPDVWNLSPTMQARPVYMKFSSLKRATLFRRLWAANSLDLILDFVLTYTSVVFNYLGPFFLKRILDSLARHEGETDQVRKQRMSLAYIYAFLGFLSVLAKAEADVQHLWYGRRAATRIRSSLMTSIYDKALKRKDFSGIIDKDAQAKKGPISKG